MKAIITAVLVIFLGILFSGMFLNCTHINQTEIGFAYHVSNGKPVNRENNPLLNVGIDVAVGYDAKHFVVNSENNRYSFTMTEDKFSLFDESMSMDSNEGATMAGDYTIIGRVIDPWKFYTFFEDGQWDYNKVEGLQDKRVYTALRLAGRYAAVKMIEISQEAKADYIMRNPKEFSDKITKMAADYADNFGFTVVEIIFPKAFMFPEGNTIDKARAQMANVNSEFETKKISAKKAEEDKKATISEGIIEANRILEQYRRKADQLLSEASALAEQLDTSINQIGVEPAVRLKLASLQGELMQEGVIPEAYLTNHSIFGRTFYGEIGRNN